MYQTHPSTPPVFLLGCPRSGTTWFGRFLGSHPRIAYLEESSLALHARRLIDETASLTIFLEKMKLADCVRTRSREGFKYQIVTGDAAAAAANEQAMQCQAALLRKLLEGHLMSTRREILLEKTPGHGNEIRLLQALFPGARFLHLIRDGRDVAGSFVTRDLFRKWGIPLQGSDDPAEAAALYWVRYVHHVRESLAVGLPYREIRYEDLVENPLKVMKGVLAWLGLGWNDALDIFLREGMGGLEDGRGRFAGRLSGKQIETVEQVAGELLELLGYAAETAAGEKARDE